MVDISLSLNHAQHCVPRCELYFSKYMFLTLLCTTSKHEDTTVPMLSESREENYRPNADKEDNRQEQGNQRKIDVNIPNMD